MNAERPNSKSSSIVRKQLFVLEKLVEEWELSGKDSKPLKFDWSRYERWERQGDIDDSGQLMNILHGLIREGLITKAEWINPAV